MLQVELVPDLSNCIETVAKKEHQKTVKQLLTAGEESEETQEKVETLRLFLETADFKKLRRESEMHLMEGRTVRFVIYLKDGALKYHMRVT